MRRFGIRQTLLTHAGQFPYEGSFAAFPEDDMLALQQA
jgi:hypothetical protein